ncbi:hypothetical protein KGM_205995 [Danaus plexippus plexippus]|uniref:Uncharacterized protein n=1 Tax=Danaus plexippus plexippus TaxID=278856 RepID=A0A212EWV8_DANPL|nr:hypothetical protein KGM_205995 [Danaus plexippus plexippus]
MFFLNDPIEICCDKMYKKVVILLSCFALCNTEEYYYHGYNVTRSTLSGIAAYRSSLTLDWLAAEDSRQRELAVAFETEAPSIKVINSDCMSYPRPTTGKIGRLMLELLKNLEGDDSALVPELVQVLKRAKLLVETSIFETEPDLDSLVKTPSMMMGEPHATFPKIIAVIWMLITDPSLTRKYGWCPINTMNIYLSNAKPHEIAKRMRTLELVMARARFIMEDFIQNITPMNMYQKVKPPKKNKPAPTDTTTQKHAMKPRAHQKFDFEMSANNLETTPGYEVMDDSISVVTNGASKLFLDVTVYFLCIYK